MKLKLFLLAVSTVFALPMDAQSRLRSTRVHNTDTLPALVKQYMDSLKVTKANIDSAVVEANTNDGKYYRLFAPLTFYHGVSENMFALEKNGDEQDRTLANIYLNRPDLVRNTQRQLDLVGPVVNPYPESVTPETELAHKVVAKADDADIEAPVDIFVAKPNFWKLSGNYSLQLFQNYVSDNWYKGGESNYSMLGTVTLQANYNNKQRVAPRSAELEGRYTAHCACFGRPHSLHRQGGLAGNEALVLHLPAHCKHTVYAWFEEQRPHCLLQFSLTALH